MDQARRSRFNAVAVTVLLSFLCFCFFFFFLSLDQNTFINTTAGEGREATSRSLEIFADAIMNREAFTNTRSQRNSHSQVERQHHHLIRRVLIRSSGTATAAKLTRVMLAGPGSYPPRCSSKCGRCTPCKPVHVPVPPGTPVIAEYYPEAWRCKCGNRLYMP